MTIRAPQKNIFDKILSIFGKERDVVVPDNTDELYKKYGPYVNIKGKRESLWKTLLKQKSKK